MEKLPVIRALDWCSYNLPLPIVLPSFLSVAVLYFIAITLSVLLLPPRLHNNWWKK